MVNTKSLVVIGASLLSLNSLAVVCSSQLSDSYGDVVREFNLPGNTKREACMKAMKSCRITLRQMQRRGQLVNGNCQKLGTIGQDSGGDNSGDTYGQYNYQLQQVQSVLRSGGWRARQQAAKSLVRYPGLKALKIAVNAVSDMDSDVRSAASSSARTLMNQVVAQSHPQDVVEALEVLTTKNSWRVRQLAVKAIAKMHSAQSILIMIKLKGDMDSDVRAAAQSGLQKAMQASDLRQVARAQKREIYELLKNNSWNTRLAAVKILGAAKLKGSVAQVVRVNGDMDSDVRAAAKKALNKIISMGQYLNLSVNKIAKLENIYSTSNKWRVRQAAVKALGATYNSMVLSTLYAALDDMDSDVRMQAKVELRKF